MPAPVAAHPSRPSLSPGARWILRATGALALLTFLTPTGYVLKYYSLDRPREEARARTVSLARLSPSVSLDSIAPPIAPAAPGNAAGFYTQAIQSFADRDKSADVSLPTPAEAGLLLEGARRRTCRYFVTGRQGKPQFFFRDPDSGGAPLPYQFPVTPHEKYRYLGAARGLAQAMTNLGDQARLDAKRRAMLATAIMRFGSSLGQEGATRTHLAVALDIERIGLRLLLPSRSPKLRDYVQAEQSYDDQVQAKYAALESPDPDNLLLQERVARGDADPMWRREAVWALGETLLSHGIQVRRPMETLMAKSALAEAAAQDPEPSVRAAAAAMLGQVMQQGAVVRRT